MSINTNRNERMMGGLRIPDDAARYAEGNREPRNCKCCGQKVWIVYHGPFANHTIEPREASFEKVGMAGGLSVTSKPEPDDSERTS